MRRVYRRPGASFGSFDLSPSGLELLVAREERDGRQTFVPQPRRSERDVKQINIEVPDPLWNGALIGLASAGGPFILIAVGSGCSYEGSRYFFCTAAAWTSALGLGAGALIDWARKDRVTVYQAPGQRSSAVRISPLLSKTAAGVQVLVGF